MTSNAPPTTHNISEFHHWDKEKVLELAPPFQRRPVWSFKNKSYLIDTILNRYPVPEIFIQIRIDAEGNRKYVVVDGQQRIRTILEFIEGEWKILDTESKHYGGKEFKDLPSGVKRDFWGYPIVTRELPTSDEEEVVAVFTRMNRYVTPLNAQELRNAVYRGHFIQLTSQLAEDDYWTDNKIVTPNDVRRMIDVEFVSELIIALIAGVQNKSNENIDGYYKMYDEDFSNKEDIKKKFNSTLNKINEILGDLRAYRWHFKNEFYALFVALNQLMKDYTIPSDRYNDISQMLENFSYEVDSAHHAEDKGKSFSDAKITDFVDSITAHTTDKEKRLKRINVIREILIPFLIRRDTRRAFTDEERRIIFSQSKDKKCVICNKVVEWGNYNVDHAISHSKGGKTELFNARITHKQCNIKKSNR